jgi:hypothetical protein
MRAKVMQMAAMAAAVLLAGTLRQSASVAQEGTDAAAQPAPAYGPHGELIFPATYREWIFLSSGIDMSYRQGGMPGHSMFDNVFVDRRAYQAFLATGTWPEKTVMVMEVREAVTQGSINVSGHFQSGGTMGVEAHVRDSKRFAGGWGFFAFNGGAPAQLLPKEAECYTCHEQHAAVDTTFVQFYPTLVPVARAHGTMKPKG